MGESHENLLKVVRHCQESLDKYTENRNDSELLHYLQILYQVPIRVVHLEETGVGRTVNGLRKLGGDVGDAAESLVAIWKEMVVGEQEEEDDKDEEEEDEDDEDRYQTGEDHSIDSDDNDSRDEKVNDTFSSHRKSDSHRTDDIDRYKEKKHKHSSWRSDHSYSKRDKDKSHKRKSDSSSSEDERPRKKSKKSDDEDRHKSKRCIESDNDTEEKHTEKKHKSDKHKSEHRSKKHREESPVNEETQKSTKSKDKHKESSSKDKHRFSSYGNNNTSSSNNKKEYSDKHEHSKKSKHKERKSKQKDKERDKSEDSKTKTPKSNKVSKESFVHSGIGSGSGASFAEALGMCEPSSSKSSSKKKPPSEKKEKSSTKVPEENVPKLLKEPTLEPIDINISSLLPPITPNYRPLGSLMTLDAQPKKCMAESEALTSIITSKNQRTTSCPADIISSVSQRRKLQENPNDVQALTEMYKSNQGMQNWAQSKQQPGQFTSSTGAQVLSQAELSSGYQPWPKKDQFTSATPVSGGMGMHLFQKMGWKPGEGLGKEKTGVLEPLLLDVKLEKKGLVASEEQKKKKQKGQTQWNTYTTHNKHPVSLLGEYAAKKKLGAPQYLCFECGPDHKKNFLFKVTLNGIEYKPNVASPNKKEAKAAAATVCLQHLGLLV